MCAYGARGQHASDFQSWYGAAEWLAPGESVTDPNNYGGPRALWAYEGTTEDGETFIAAAISP